MVHFDSAPNYGVYSIFLALRLNRVGLRLASFMFSFCRSARNGRIINYTIIDT